MSNRSRKVSENILKTGAVQVQQIKYRNIICICNSNNTSTLFTASSYIPSLSWDRNFCCGPQSHRDLQSSNSGAQLQKHLMTSCTIILS